MADAVGIATVHVQGWRTAYAGIVPKEYLASLSYEQSVQIWCDYLSREAGNTFAYVADEPAAKCVGFVAGGTERSGDTECRGELYALYVSAEYQHKGFGRKLVLHSVERFLAQGIDSMIVWVLAENPFRSFYEALGGRPAGKRVVTIGGAELAEIAYSWSDLRLATLGAVREQSLEINEADKL